MKHILMIATGGTIASKNTGAGLKPALTSRELLDCVPEIESICSVEAVQLFNLDSTNIRREHWLAIAQRIEAEYGNYDGFVVTHGTDTMAYTAAALSYLIQNNKKPVVLTGSQKSVYLRDTDARKNLYDAFAYCADDRANGVHIVFDGNVIMGTRAKKTRTHSYNAFSSVDFPEIAIMREGKPFYYIDEAPEGDVRFYRAMSDRVFVLKLIPGLRPEIFDYLSEHCDGVVLETFGSGGLPDYDDDGLFRRLKGFLAGGGSVVITTQVEREGSALSRYAVGRRLLDCGNVLEARSMTLEACVTKLMWALAYGGSPEGTARLFSAPVGHDIF